MVRQHLPPYARAGNGVCLINLLIRLGTALATFLALQSVAHAATISFDDDITPQTMTKLIVQIEQAHTNGDRNITVELNSDGGNLGSALWANEQMRKVGVNTLVKKSCASSCTVLFAAGTTRTASNDAQFMFHSVDVAHLASSVKKSRTEVAIEYSNNWLAAVRVVAPMLADRLQKNRTLINGHPENESWFSGRDLRKYGYVND